MVVREYKEGKMHGRATLYWKDLPPRNAIYKDGSLIKHERVSAAKIYFSKDGEVKGNKPQSTTPAKTPSSAPAPAPAPAKAPGKTSTPAPGKTPAPATNLPMSPKSPRSPRKDEPPAEVVKSKASACCHLF